MKILYVDDDLSLLDAAKLRFRNQFEVITVESGKEALKQLNGDSVFAVVVSDLRMPGMDGIQLLSHVREISPDTVRIILSGNADLETAVQAVNEGKIFQFLTKPFHWSDLEKAIEAGIRQYRVLLAERELLENTLNESTKVLMELLALTNPVAFGRASRVKDYTLQIARKLELHDVWQLELASMLSQIGCITIPPDTLERRYYGESLSEEEAKMFQVHPKLGGELICHIPRLESVSEIISYQDQKFDGSDAVSKNTKTRREIPAGARILKIALDFDTLCASGVNKEKAVQTMKERTGWYDPQILEALSGISVFEGTMVRQKVSVADLLPHMVLAEDVKSERGLLLASKGQSMTPSLKERLKNFELRGELRGEVAVLVRASDGTHVELAVLKSNS